MLQSQHLDHNHNLAVNKLDYSPRIATIVQSHSQLHHHVGVDKLVDYSPRIVFFYSPRIVAGAKARLHNPLPMAQNVKLWQRHIGGHLNIAAGFSDGKNDNCEIIMMDLNSLKYQSQGPLGQI